MFGIWDLGNLGVGVLVNLGSWKFGILGIWNLRNYGSWEFAVTILMLQL